MKFPQNVIATIGRAWKRVDPFSLQVRLTIGVVLVSALGLGGVAGWTGWQMQQILIASQKQQIWAVVDRLSQDAALYSEMMPVKAGLQKAIDNRTTVNLLLWVSQPDGSIIAQSQALSAPSTENHQVTQQLLAFSGKLMAPQIHQIHGHYWALCGIPLTVKGETVGKLYAAQDITSEQTMFIAAIRILSIASLLSVLGMTFVIAYYVRRSLSSLRQMSQLAGVISAEDLGQARIELKNAPSEVKELAEMWDKMLSRLSGSWEQQRQFVSNVSHELRTPLAIVHGYLQSTLRRSDNLTEMQREALEIAASEADRTIRLLQDLLDLARADSGYMHFQMESLDLNELVSELAEMAEKYSNRAIALEAEHRIWVKADRNRLQQVLMNLINNAVKYSEPSESIIINLSQADHQVTIQVSDHGCGIPLQHQTRIFEPFYRVDEARARTTGGTGLGLSIVKTLVEGMNGTITVRSKIGVGSTFTITLPAA
ncbi:MAG: HAMP domain-containing histidine kinase [Scytolyngbya sp. HA4215-MV1]|nr:HAMP domain-containing histidine kinase [Scytolyngbya sp. HA4215-MV1]